MLPFFKRKQLLRPLFFVVMAQTMTTASLHTNVFCWPQRQFWRAMRFTLYAEHINKNLNPNLCPLGWHNYVLYVIISQLVCPKSVGADKIVKIEHYESRRPASNSHPTNAANFIYHACQWKWVWCRFYPWCDRSCRHQLPNILSTLQRYARAVGRRLSRVPWGSDTNACARWLLG